MIAALSKREKRMPPLQAKEEEETGSTEEKRDWVSALLLALSVARGHSFFRSRTILLTLSERNLERNEKNKNTSRSRGAFDPTEQALDGKAAAATAGEFEVDNEEADEKRAVFVSATNQHARKIRPRPFRHASRRAFSPGRERKRKGAVEREKERGRTRVALFFSCSCFLSLTSERARERERAKQLGAVAISGEVSPCAKTFASFSPPSLNRSRRSRRGSTPRRTTSRRTSSTLFLPERQRQGREGAPVTTPLPPSPPPLRLLEDEARQRRSRAATRSNSSSARAECSRPSSPPF